jgi:hypothetical protein
VDVSITRTISIPHESPRTGFVTAFAVEGLRPQKVIMREKVVIKDKTFGIKKTFFIILLVP